MSISPHTNVNPLVTHDALTPVTTAVALPITLAVPKAPVAETPVTKTLLIDIIDAVPKALVS